SADEQRGIIARYSAVLEGNFIYWMTAAHLAVASDEARAIIEDNLREEVRDNHPGMLRRFAIAAHAVPTDTDASTVYRNLEHVRGAGARARPGGRRRPPHAARDRRSPADRDRRACRADDGGSRSARRPRGCMNRVS